MNVLNRVNGSGSGQIQVLCNGLTLQCPISFSSVFAWSLPAVCPIMLLQHRNNTALSDLWMNCEMPQNKQTAVLNCGSWQ